MTDGDRDPGLAQFLDDIAFGNVGALHLVAQAVHDLGDARHADAADADEVNRAEIGPERLHAGTPPANSVRTRGVSSGPTRVGARPSPMRSTRSARSRAAWGRPTDK